MFTQPDIAVAAVTWRQAVLILLFFLIAWIIHRLAYRMAGRFTRLSRWMARKRLPSQQRLKTLRSLIAGVISFFGFLIAILASLSLFVDASSLVWFVGLFSAGFGLAARPLVSDFLSGVSFIFEDTFEVGDKVELPGLPGGPVSGIVEGVHLRTSLIRAATGEPYVVPNGEIRVVRNFSRGRFSTANIKVKVAAHDLNRALAILEELGQEAVTFLPNLLEPWQVISETGEMGPQTALTLVAKSRYGNAAEMRPRLLTLVQERLARADIELVG